MSLPKSKIKETVVHVGHSLQLLSWKVYGPYKGVTNLLNCLLNKLYHAIASLAVVTVVVMTVQSNMFYEPVVWKRRVLIGTFQDQTTSLETAFLVRVQFTLVYRLA